MIGKQLRLRCALVFLAWFVGGAAHASCLDSLAEHRLQIKNDYLQSADSPFDKKFRDSFAGFTYFEGDSAYCVPASFEPSVDTKVFAMPSFNGKTLPFRRYGVFHFQLGGAQRSLLAYQRMDLPEDQRQWVLIPFRDRTTGRESYGGGRYLQVDLPIPVRTSLDFNRAFNPLCAYEPTFTCPVPPRENWLKVRIAAGEKMYAGKH